MDDRVLRGMAKWPDVPAVYGWLSLDRRGSWRIKGERVNNAMVVAFIGRNYERDGEGRWYFQNGPQRVYVRLDYTPLVYRIVSPPGAPLALECHTGYGIASLRGAWVDEDGTLLLESERGIGLVHDRDLERLFPYLTGAGGNPLEESDLEQRLESLGAQRETSIWLRFGDSSITIKRIRSAEVAKRFRFTQAPERPPGQDACQ